MSGAVVGLAILLALAAGAAYVAGYARGRGGLTVPTAPDHVTDEVMHRMVEELRDCQAEVERYRRTVERLQQERGEE